MPVPWRWHQQFRPCFCPRFKPATVRLLKVQGRCDVAETWPAGLAASALGVEHSAFSGFFRLRILRQKTLHCLDGRWDPVSVKVAQPTFAALVKSTKSAVTVSAIGNLGCVTSARYLRFGKSSKLARSGRFERILVGMDNKPNDTVSERILCLPQRGGRPKSLEELGLFEKEPEQQPITS